MQTIYLDISNKGVIPCIQAKQSEVGRKFLAVITDNGVPYNIQNNSLLSVWYEGDTDAGNYSSIEEKSAFVIDGNKVTVELVAQMLLKPGKGELCLSISHGDGGETNTWNIPYEVEHKPGSGSAVPSEYYTALTDAAARAAEQVGLAKDQAGIATQAADQAQEAVSGYVKKSELLDSVYPIGAIYISVSDSSPKTLFGGDWEQIRGRFLLSESADIPAGSYGGEENHTLTIEEMPSHRHQAADANGNQLNYNGNAQIGEGNSGISGGVDWSNMWTSYTGGGNPFSIMPPYFSVYMWKRIA